jgi:predicted dehydrogenase
VSGNPKTGIAGAIATITATTTAAPGFPHRVEIYGTAGGIQVEGESAGQWKLVDPTAAAVGPPQPRTPADAGAGGDPRDIAPTGHIAILRDFVRALREEREPMISGREGRRSLATVLAIYKAAGLL